MQERRHLPPDQFAPDPDLADHVDQQSLGVLTQVLDVRRDVERLAHRDGPVLLDQVLRVHRADRGEREIARHHQLHHDREGER